MEITTMGLGFRNGKERENYYNGFRLRNGKEQN